MLKKIFVLAALMITAACQALAPGSQETISVGELTKEYEKSEQSVRQKYDGKEITVRGYTLIEATMPQGNADEGLISLEEKDGNPVLQVNCWFNKTDVPAFSKIKGDQFITVKGVFNGEITTELKFCKLVKVE